MKHKPRNERIERLWDWLEARHAEIDWKLDHILLRLREEDPRIYQNGNEKYELRSKKEQELKDT